MIAWLGTGLLGDDGVAQVRALVERRLELRIGSGSAAATELRALADETRRSILKRLAAGDARAIKKIQPEAGLRHLEVLRGLKDGSIERRAVDRMAMADVLSL